MKIDLTIPEMNHIAYALNTIDDKEKLSDTRSIMDKIRNAYQELYELEAKCDEALKKQKE